MQFRNKNRSDFGCLTINLISFVEARHPILECFHNVRSIVRSNKKLLFLRILYFSVTSTTWLKIWRINLRPQKSPEKLMGCQRTSEENLLEYAVSAVPLHSMTFPQHSLEIENGRVFESFSHHLGRAAGSCIFHPISRQICWRRYMCIFRDLLRPSCRAPARTWAFFVRMSHYVMLGSLSLFARHTEMARDPQCLFFVSWRAFGWLGITHFLRARWSDCLRVLLFNFLLRFPPASKYFTLE